MPQYIPKGNRGGECNRSVCHSSPAEYFNHSTKKFYCKKCALDIQEYENTLNQPLVIFIEFWKERI